ENTTLFMCLLAAFKLLLYRNSGQEDILVGSPFVGRPHHEVRDLIGLFAYPLVFRTDLSGNPTFQQLLARVRDVTLGAYEHKDLHFAKVIKPAKPKRLPGIPPLFQVIFTFPPPQSPIHSSGLVWSPIEDLVEATVEYDLCLSILPRSEGLVAALMYSSE